MNNFWTQCKVFWHNAMQSKAASGQWALWSHCDSVTNWTTGSQYCGWVFLCARLHVCLAFPSVWLCTAPCLCVRVCTVPCLCESVHCARQNLFGEAPFRPRAIFHPFSLPPPIFTTTHSKSINRNLPAQLSWSLKTNVANSDWVGEWSKMFN